MELKQEEMSLKGYKASMCFQPFWFGFEKDFFQG